MIERGGEHVSILHLVGRLPRAGTFQAHPKRLLCPVEYTHAMGMPPDPIGAVVTDAAINVAMKLIRTDRMQPADQGRTIAGGAQAVSMGRDAGGKDVGIGPAADPVAVLRRQHRHTRRCAKGSRGVGVVEGHALGCEPIKCRRLNDRIAITASDVLGVLIREQKQDIGAIVTHDDGSTEMRASSPGAGV